MKKYLRHAAGLVVVFFAAGYVWGHWSRRLQAHRIAHSVPLRVLCGEKWLSLATLEKFSIDNDIRIEHYTYSNPGDFLRQLANADGKVDVICSSSLLVRSLVRSHWLKKGGLSDLPNLKLLSGDFQHLPYDSADEYTVPLFWNLYGFFGKGERPKASWRQTWASSRVSLWGEELNVLHLMNRLDLNAGERLIEDQRIERISHAFKKFLKGSLHFYKPVAGPLNAEAVAGKFDWLELPLGHVADLLAGKDSPYRFWLPEDGATVEVGTLSIGEKSAQPELARALINELLSTPSALVTHQQLDAGVVHKTLSGQTPALQKPEALRLFPLNRLNFPDVDVQDLPHFQKVFASKTDD
jgi:spermidine/putrescine-binding protein